METIAILLNPVVWCMGAVFRLYVAWFGSPGLAILALSATFALLLYPLQRRVNVVEKRIAGQIKIVQRDVAQIDRSLKGEARFNATEEIYQRHNYHPIKSAMVGVGFLVSLPILLSAIVLFTKAPELVGNSFLYISDLSQPDRYLSLGTIALNITPVLMLMLTSIDAQIRYGDNRPMRTRFLIVSIALFILVYTLPAGLILYWIGANCMSFLFYTINKRLAAYTKGS